VPHSADWCSRALELDQSDHSVGRLPARTTVLNRETGFIFSRSLERVVSDVLGIPTRKDFGFAGFKSVAGNTSSILLGKEMSVFGRVELSSNIEWMSR
jgi:hypothetical protein